MLTVVANKENSRVISIPADEMEKLGFSDGDEVELSEENGAMVVRSAAEAERKRRFERAKDEILEEWHDVLVALAKGVDDKSVEAK